MTPPGRARHAPCSLASKGAVPREHYRCTGAAGRGNSQRMTPPRYCACRRTLGTVLHCNFGAVSYCGLGFSALDLFKIALIRRTGPRHFSSWRVNMQPSKPTAYRGGHAKARPGEPGRRRRAGAGLCAARGTGGSRRRGRREGIRAVHLEQQLGVDAMTPSGRDHHGFLEYFHARCVANRWPPRSAVILESRFRLKDS
jgi:hypothetical protein